MDITTTSYKHCDVIKVTGRIDSLTSPKLGETLATLAEKGRYRIVIDLNETEFISSAGLWVLVNAQKTCKRYNRGAVVLACVPAKIHATLDLAGFIPLFTLFGDVTAAVGSF